MPYISSMAVRCAEHWTLQLSGARKSILPVNFAEFVLAVAYHGKYDIFFVCNDNPAEPVCPMYNNYPINLWDARSSLKYSPKLKDSHLHLSIFCLYIYYL